MADITLVIQFTVNKGSLIVQENQVFNATKSDESWDGPVLDIGTAEEDVVFVADLTLPAIVLMKNMGATDVRWGPKSAGAMVPLGRIASGETYPLRLDSNTVVLRMISVTAANKVRFWAAGGV